LIRIRALPPEFQKSDYPHMIGVSWAFDGEQSNGMPSPEIVAEMDRLEDLLVPALEGTGQAVLTVVVTGGGVREWQWYARSPEETSEIVNAALAGQESFPVEFSLQDDPAWEAYGQFQA
jgi:hypothetical protein